MEDKVLLFDANNVKIGETFMRRAKQLVSRQRAEWTDESHIAIRFAPDAEEPPIVIPEAADESPDDSWIYAAAEKQIRERHNFILHSVAFLPGIFMLFLFTTAFLDSVLNEPVYFFCFMLGGWITAYAIHAWFFAQKRLKGFRLLDSEKRKAYRLSLEVEKIKRNIAG
jgi:hypothetical protein